MRNVFILYENALFARGLERLLRQEGIEVLGIAPHDGDALSRIKKLDLGVLIVETGREKSAPEILFSGLIRERRQARVIHVNLEDNTCISYSGCLCTADSAQDLVECVVGSMATERGTGSQVCSYAERTK